MAPVARDVPGGSRNGEWRNDDHDRFVHEEDLGREALRNCGGRTQNRPCPYHQHVTYTGDISGESSVNYVIFNPEETVGVFRGYEQISGKVGDRQGSFVLEHVGSWEGGTVSTSWSVSTGRGPVTWPASPGAAATWQGTKSRKRRSRSSTSCQDNAGQPSGCCGGMNLGLR